MTTTTHSAKGDDSMEQADGSIQEGFDQGISYEKLREGINIMMADHYHEVQASGKDSQDGQQHMSAYLALDELRTILDPNNEPMMRAVELLLEANEETEAPQEAEHMNGQDIDPDRYVLSEAENTRIFHNELEPILFRQARVVERPSAHFFGGQPGAGKSFIQAKVSGRLIAEEGPGSFVTIIGDDFKHFHPEYYRLQLIDNERAAFYTDKDSARWVEQAIDASLETRSHVILEGTLRNPDVTIGSATEYKQHDFETQLHIPAIDGRISRLRILERYFGLPQGTRYTLREAHDRAYDVLPDSLYAIAQSKKFARISLYDLNGQTVITVTPDMADGPDQLVAALQLQRQIEPKKAEEYLKLLASLEEQARDTGKEEVLKDIENLKVDLNKAFHSE